MKNEEYYNEQWEKEWERLQTTLAQLTNIMGYLSGIEQPTDDQTQSIQMLQRSLKRICKTIYFRHKSEIDRFRKERKREAIREQMKDWQ